MDTGVIIISVIMLGAFVVPIILMQINRKKKEKKLQNSLKEFAKKHNCQISQLENCRDFVVGVDTQKKQFFYYKPANEKGKEVAKSIDLSGVQSCRVVNYSRSVNNNGTVIDKLQLGFSPKVKTKPEILLDFYDAEKNMQMDGELLLLEKWTGILNKLG
jgi:hypothetical protein